MLDLLFLCETEVVHLLLAAHLVAREAGFDLFQLLPHACLARVAFQLLRATMLLQLLLATEHLVLFAFLGHLSLQSNVTQHGQLLQRAHPAVLERRFHLLTDTLNMLLHTS